MSRSIIRAALLLAAAFTSGTHCAAAEDAKTAVAATPPTTIYETSLAPGWDNWSWAKTTLGTELSGSARKPIKVEAAGWQALYLHHEGFNTTGLKRLSLLIQGSVPDREVRVSLIIGGKPVGEGKLVKLSNTGWTDVKVPLVTLGVEDTVIDGIWVQNASAEDLPKFFVTDIKLD
jgi:hypothetical protein